MQDIFFTDASEAPVPPEEVRIRELEAEPRADGWRVAVRTALTPFQQRPNIEVRITNEAGREVAALSVVEAIDAVMDFTMHLREPEPGGEYKLSLRVFYVDLEVHAAEEGEEVQASRILDEASQTVDARELSFHISKA